MKKKNLLERVNCIIDTDPGVDDSAAFVLSLYDDIMNIRLITTVNGNLDVDIVTRNALHLLEMFNRTDIPLAKGAARPMKRPVQHAIFAHKENGMGNYTPPKTVKTQPIKQSAVDAMYETIKQFKNNIEIIMQGPTTNIGELFTKYPEVKGWINHIYYEGCAAWDSKLEGNWKNYRSFNASSDPEALKIMLESGIPITMIPSRMGRDLAYFTEEEVNAMGEINDVGRWIKEMYTGYWEPNYKHRRVATNDTCAVLAMRFPELFKVKRAFVEVDVGDELPGKTTFTFSKKGNIEYAYKVNRKKFHALYFNAIRKLTRFDLTKQLEASALAKEEKLKQEQNKANNAATEKVAKVSKTKTTAKQPAKATTKKVAAAKSTAKTTTKAKSTTKTSTTKTSTTKSSKTTKAKK